MRVDTNKAPFENCPQFDTCSVNKCPLHPNFFELQNADGDESKCRATKPTRVKIFSLCRKTYPLLNQGLTIKEMSRLRQSTRMKALMNSTGDNNE